MADKIDDSNRHLRLHSPLGDKLGIQYFKGEEEVGRLFEYRLELVSTDPELDFDKIVGQRISIEMDLQQGQRFFDGFVTEFRFLSIDERWARYEATVRPWFWFLTRTSDCRIFQIDQGGIKNVPDIIKSVFNDHGMADVDYRLNGSYRDWDYCAQYRETDFNFLCRLMEQEGIYFFFEHEKGKHTLVLADDSSAHNPFPDHAKLPYDASPIGVRKEQVDHLQSLTVSQSILPGKFAVNDFDFEKPKVGLLAKVDRAYGHSYEIGDPEIYDYPGEYKQQADGDNYIKRRMEEAHCQHERIQAAGPCRVLSPGCIVTLEDHPRADQNRDYLVVSARYSFWNGGFESRNSSAEQPYFSDVELLDKKHVFRSARVTPKPIVQGCQTAMVVGPSSEEIYCDKYGRVKVQFHWDRYGQNDENSSCWIRVSQAWAGKEWGSMHIPRIGQEVIVSYLEGDPDQPIITGRVYNADSMPIWGLPGSKTQSGIVSRSTPGGGPSNYNEVRMEDSKGSELLSIQAEKDETILVKNNKQETVGNNETISIGNDRTEDVGHDETRTVGNNETVTIMNSRTDTVAVDETRTVSNNRTRNVANNEVVTVGVTRTHTVGVNEAITVGGAQEFTVGGIQSFSVGGMQETSVGASRSVEVMGGQSEEIGGALNTEVGADWAIDVGSDYAAKAGKKINIEAGDEIAFKCGGASIVMKKNGNVTIKGKNITLKASGKATVKAGSSLTLKAPTIKEN